ncbi:FAD-dependent monooxygenase [Paenarthrobacter ureafaciens]
MTAVQKVAIAGSGVAAMATAIQLAKAGIAVEVFEAKPELSALGSGITLQGNALRVFDALGVWEDVRDKGLAFEGLTLRAPGPDAPVIAQLPEVKTGGPDYPACMGMYRPDLAKILMQHAEKAGATVNFRAKVTGFREVDPARVEVFVNDESAGTFDLLIGADGVNSTVRSLMGIETAPETTGMGIWRAFVSRPKDVEHSELYYGGPAYIAGYTPTGEDTMYAFLVEKAQDRFGVSDEQAVEIMRGESMAYGGAMELDPRGPQPGRKGQLHLVHQAPGARPVEPWPGGHHRRRRAQLPSDDRPGRCAGPRGCFGSGRAADRFR